MYHTLSIVKPLSFNHVITTHAIVRFSYYLITFIFLIILRYNIKMDFVVPTLHNASYHQSFFDAFGQSIFSISNMKTSISMNEITSWSFAAKLLHVTYWTSHSPITLTWPCVCHKKMHELKLHYHTFQNIKPIKKIMFKILMDVFRMAFRKQSKLHILHHQSFFDWI